MVYVEFMKNFFSPIRASWWLLDSFRPPEPKNVWLRRVDTFSSDLMMYISASTFDSYFLDLMYVDLMKNFLLADSSELMAVRLISAAWAQKRLIPTF